jgi:hypothetical protein
MIATPVALIYWLGSGGDISKVLIILNSVLIVGFVLQFQSLQF